MYVNWNTLLTSPNSPSYTCIVFSTVSVPRVVVVSWAKEWWHLPCTSASVSELTRVSYLSLYPTTSLRPGSAAVWLKNEKEILVRSLNLPPVPCSPASSGYSLVPPLQPRRESPSADTCVWSLQEGSCTREIHMKWLSRGTFLSHLTHNHLVMQIIQECVLTSVQGTRKPCTSR